MSALSVAQQVLDDKDTIRQTMSKVPEYRQVDDLEKTVTYLTNLGFWKKFDNLDDGVTMTKSEICRYMQLTAYWKKRFCLKRR